MLESRGYAWCKTYRDDLGILPKPLVVDLEAVGVVADASGKLGVELRKFKVR